MKTVFHAIPIEKIVRGKYQPRQQFDDKSLSELAVSIKANGLIQPIIVRSIKNNYYEIVAGERRWRAAQLAGLDRIDCIIKNYRDEQAAEIATIENVNRADLNSIEEAKAYKRLIDEFGQTQEEIAATIGKSRPHVANMVRLLKLSQEVQVLIIQGKLSEGHGKVLVNVPENQQRALANKCSENGWSVRKLEDEVKKLQKNNSSIKNKTDVNIKILERNLTEHIGCPATIDFSGDKGKLIIDFYNLEILQGLLKKIGLGKDE